MTQIKSEVKSHPENSIVTVIYVRDEPQMQTSEHLSGKKTRTLLRTAIGCIPRGLEGNDGIVPWPAETLRGMVGAV